MQANQFRRLALAQGLLSSRWEPAPEKDDAGAASAAGCPVNSDDASPVERTPEAVH